MSISVNGQSQVPPGFRFHPTEEELLQYYLKKKVALEKIDLDVIQDVDLNKLEPWDIQEKCKIGSTPQNDWYFFSHKDKKYPTGTRTNRATASGFWKATGRDKVIYGNSRRIGMRKTLVFYKGRAPHGQKSDWIMHEYRLDDNTTGMQEEGWVVCRVFKKKNHSHKTSDSPISTPCPNSSCRNQTCYQPLHVQMLGEEISDPGSIYQSETSIGIQDWAALDRLVASHLNGQNETSKQLSSFTHNNDSGMSFCCPPDGNPDDDQLVHQDYQNECDLWSFARSSNDQLCHLSNVPIFVIILNLKNATNLKNAGLRSILVSFIILKSTQTEWVRGGFEFGLISLLS
ncbi:hypothetical protein Pfo_005974 [Paulownia fortunei]|nr:hypothetical protein Pfo_005974 [Paulownia fortunei]